ncbi:MAG: hypothetical protein JKY96_03335 [Phycisphaerales bacterium]|nr:hypothetical protein [Phycisphaerales bacterium]
MKKKAGKILRWTLPPGISLCVHALLIGLILVVSSTITTIEEPKERIPLATLAVAPSEPAAPKPDIEQETPKDPVPQSEFDKDKIRPESLARAIAALGNHPSTAPAMDPVSFAALSQAAKTITAPTSTAPPTVLFAGVQTQAAKKVVYVVDGSGAAAASFSSLQTQLLRSIDQLSTTQRFQVVLFRKSGDSLVSLAPIGKGKMAYATRGNKQIVSDWLDSITTRGRSNPVDGLRSAIALKPDLVLLITRSIQRTGDGDAWGVGRQQILSELDQLNPRSSRTGNRKIVIKAIQLLDDDPTGIMQGIAGHHGDGLNDYRVVSYEDLRRKDNPQEQRARRTLGATDEQRLMTASEILASITTPGIMHTMLYGLATEEQGNAARDAAAQIDALASPLISKNPGAAILAGSARLMQYEGGDHSVELEQFASMLEKAVFTDPNADANRQLIVASMHQAMGNRDDALEMVHAVLEHADELEVDDLIRGSALLALCALGAEPEEIESLAQRAPFQTSSGMLDPLWSILLAEARTRGRLANGQSDPWSPLVYIRSIASEDESLVRYIDAKIASGVRRFAINSTEQLASAPSEVILAASNAMGANPDTRMGAIELLQVVADRDDPIASPEALWRIGVVGRAHNTSSTRSIAGDALATLATKYPEHPLAGDALTGAIANAPRSDLNRRRGLLRQALDRYPERLEGDLWRLELARLSEDFARLDVLDGIATNTREAVLGGELYEQTILSMLTRFDDPVVRRALLSRMSDTAGRLGLGSAPGWAQRAAAAELSIDPDAAARRLTRLIADAKAKGQNTGELELLRARALIDAGKKVEAFGLLNAIAARQDTTNRRNDTYWQAWALMLETIARGGTDSDKARARAHITRLTLVDPQLGGSPWKERITRVSDELHSQP